MTTFENLQITGDEESLRDLRMLLASARNIAEIQQKYSGFDYKSVIRDLEELEDKIEIEITK
jgi:hypothetical protein